MRGVSKKNSRKTDRRESKRRNSPVVPLRTGQSGTGGAVDRGDQVGSAGVQQESLSREVGHGSFSMGSGRDLVSPEGVDEEGDRVFLVEGRGEKSGGRELLGEGKRDVFFIPQPSTDDRDEEVREKDIGHVAVPGDAGAVFVVPHAEIGLALE